jgi:redox-sensitive bicupin YhaK (pirin superfamily)
MFSSRQIDKVILSRWQSEGLGAKVRRSIGTEQLRSFSPFLMLDEFNAGLPAAFPDHPHRGMETVSFLLPSSEGWFEHEDFLGHKGLLKAGGLQWMTAGRGILHSEVPFDERPAHGLQLWVNLPREHKMTHAVAPGVDVAVISGSSLGVESPVRTIVPVHYLYVKLAANSVFEQPCDPSWNALIYTLNGSVKLEGDKVVAAHHTVTFAANAASSGVRVATAAEPAEFVYLAGQPIHEPVVRLPLPVCSGDK